MGAASYAMAPAVEEETEQPDVYRAHSSGPFHFEHCFGRDNPGEFRDSYVVDAVLGSGTYGKAYRATCKRSGLVRAVKVVPKRRDKDAVRLANEICLGRTLSHPNVVRLYDTFQEEGSTYMVMEVCMGGELYDRITDQAPQGFPEPRAATYAEQMLSAVCYLHANCVAHRDIKPENFLLQNSSMDSELKLIDFGLASSFQRGTPMTTRVGTPFYVAPEVLAGSYTEVCDVWSLGVIVYICLCGYPPFSGDNDREILRNVKSGNVSFPSPDWQYTSSQAKDFVRRLLTFDPPARVSAGQALANPWVLRGRQGAWSEAPFGGEEFLARLEAFHRQPRVKRVALTAVARQLPDERIDGLQKAFRALDADGDGAVSMVEVYEALQARGHELPQSFDAVLRSVDSDGSGRLDYVELLAATADARLAAQRDVCLAAFHSFDRDGDGLVSKEEFANALLSDDFERVLRQDAVDKLFTEADADGDGFISCADFCRILAAGGDECTADDESMARRLSDDVAQEPTPGGATPQHRKPMGCSVSAISLSTTASGSCGCDATPL